MNGFLYSPMLILVFGLETLSFANIFHLMKFDPTYVLESNPAVYIPILKRKKMLIQSFKNNAKVS